MYECIATLLLLPKVYFFPIEWFCCHLCFVFVCFRTFYIQVLYAYCLFDCKHASENRMYISQAVNKMLLFYWNNFARKKIKKCSKRFFSQHNMQLDRINVAVYFGTIWQIHVLGLILFERGTFFFLFKNVFCFNNLTSFVKVLQIASDKITYFKFSYRNSYLSSLWFQFQHNVQCHSNSKWPFY